MCASKGKRRMLSGKEGGGEGGEGGGGGEKRDLTLLLFNFRKAMLTEEKWAAAVKPKQTRLAR
jgi:hypothetical protein